MATVEIAAAPPRGELLRVLGIGFGLAVVVGGAVGQGILRTPGIVAGAVPSPLLILALWAFAGLMAAVDAFAIVELGAAVPRSGGPYALAARALGPVAGVMVGWADLINCIAAVGFLSVVFAEYTQRLGLLGGVPLGALSAGVIAIFVLVNASGTRTSGASQGLGTAAKGIGLLALVVVLFAVGKPPPAAPAAPPPALTLAAFAIALRAIYNTYQGWSAGVYFCEEIHAPERNLARSMFGGLALIAGLYVLVNAALLHVLTPAQMAASTLPAADAAAQVFGDASGVLVTALALISVGAVTNLTIMFLSRIAHAMAKDGVLPAALSLVSGRGTPWVALVVTSGAGAALAATGSYLQLVAISAPAAIAITAAMDAGVIALRVREPGLRRPFRMPLYPLPAVIGLAVNVALIGALVYEDPLHSLGGIGLAAVIGLLYALRRRMTAKAPAGGGPIDWGDSPDRQYRRNLCDASVAKCRDST